MAPGSSSRISKQLILFTSFACLLLGISSAQSAPQSAEQKTGTKRNQAAATPSPEVPEQLDKVADVQIKSAVKVLQEGRPGAVFVIIRNISNVPVIIRQVDVSIDGKVPTPDSDKDSIKATLTEFTSGQTIRPQHVHRLRVDLSAAGQIEEGAHLLLVQVHLQWNKDNKPLTGSLLASHDFNVEVLGVSGILSVLGASSILFLPGFLAVTVFLVLNRLWAKIRQGEKFQLDLKSPEFWMVVLTLSLFAPSIYRLVSRVWLGEQRDYLKGYGLSDVVLIWFASIIIATVCWGLYRLIRETLVQYIENKRRSLANYGDSLEPESNDRPDELLDKLARRWEWNSLSLYRKLQIIRNPTAAANSDSNQNRVKTFPQGYPEYVEIRIDGSDESYFLIERAPRQAAQIFVVPPIEYKYIEPRDGGPEAAYERFRTTLDTEIAGRNVVRIAELFVEGERQGWLNVNWGKLASGEEKAPRFVRPAQLQYRPDVRIMFFQQRQTG